MRAVLACVLAAALAGALFGATRDPGYRARSYVIQVPSGLGSDRGLALARSDRVMSSAIELSGVRGVAPSELRDRSRAELTSRRDLSFEVRAPEEEQAVALATAYAKAFRAAIPDDRGLPVRGSGARRASPEPGVLAWTLAGAFAGLAAGLAFVLVRDGLRRGSGRGPRRASPPCAPGSAATRG